MPPVQATEHDPLQVMLQVPAPHVTLDPAPTVTVQLLPEQTTLLPAPPVPVHVEPEAQLKRAVVLLPKSHVSFAGQSHESPLHTDALHPSAIAPSTPNTTPTRTKLRIELIETSSGPLDPLCSNRKSHTTRYRADSQAKARCRDTRDACAGASILPTASAATRTRWARVCIQHPFTPFRPSGTNEG